MDDRYLQNVFEGKSVATVKSYANTLSVCLRVTKNVDSQRLVMSCARSYDMLSMNWDCSATLKKAVAILCSIIRANPGIAPVGTKTYWLERLKELAMIVKLKAANNVASQKLLDNWLEYTAIKAKVSEILARGDGHRSLKMSQEMVVLAMFAYFTAPQPNRKLPAGPRSPCMRHIGMHRVSSSFNALFKASQPLCSRRPARSPLCHHLTCKCLSIHGQCGQAAYRTSQYIWSSSASISARMNSLLRCSARACSPLEGDGSVRSYPWWLRQAPGLVHLHIHYRQHSDLTHQFVLQHQPQGVLELTVGHTSHEVLYQTRGHTSYVGY